MDTLAALAPPVVVCAAFVAILVAVKRLADREEAEDRTLDPTEPGDTAGDRVHRQPPGPRVRMIPVDGPDDDEGDLPKPPAG